MFVPSYGMATSAFPKAKTAINIDMQSDDEISRINEEKEGDYLSPSPYTANI